MLALAGMSLIRRCWKASVACSRDTRSFMADVAQGASVMGALMSPSSRSSRLGRHDERARASKEAAQHGVVSPGN